MKLKTLLFLSHGAAAMVAGAVVALIAVVGLDLEYLFAATTIALIAAMLFTLFIASRIKCGIQMLEETVTRGEGPRGSNVVEFNRAAERIYESAQRWVAVATSSREQTREVTALLAQFDRRSQERPKTHAPNAGYELRQCLRGLSNSIDEQLTKIVQSVDEVTSCTQDITTGSEIQSDATRRATSFVEQLSATVESVFTNVGKTRTTTLTARNSAIAAHALAEGLASGLDRIRLLVETSGKKASALDERADEVSAIIETLGGIVSRTDLLALNASIESVRAGEHGRGFAVVAEEIRRLAEQAAQATNEVVHLIESIQAETRESIAVIALEQTEVEEESKRVASMGDALQQIGDMTKDAISQVDEIDGAIQHQRRFAEKLIGCVEQISDAAKTSRSWSERAGWKAKSAMDTARQLDLVLAPMRGDSSRVAVPRREALSPGIGAALVTSADDHGEESLERQLRSDNLDDCGTLVSTCGENV